MSDGRVRTATRHGTGVATDFGLSRATAARLFDNGREAAARCLDGDGVRPAWDFEEYKRRFRRPPQGARP